jgi:Ferritin-like
MTTKHIASLTQKPAEPPATLAELQHYLQAALEIEHLTIPVYLTGLYSIRPGSNRYAYDSIRSVVMEEMLHMTLVANILNAVGADPEVAHSEFLPNYPAVLPMSDPPHRIPLQSFSPEALHTFTDIEQPRRRSDASNQASWTSIGQFYDLIRQGLENLVRNGKEEAVFAGTDARRRAGHKPPRQIDSGQMYNTGGRLFPVAGLADALRAIEVISEQGEGADGTIFDSDHTLFHQEMELAHYFRFMEIRESRRYGPHDRADQPPSGPALEISWKDAYRSDPSPKVAQYEANPTVHAHAVRFNKVYARLLLQLEDGFRGKGRIADAVLVMRELGYLAQQLFRNPHPDPVKARAGLRCAPTFEVTPQDFDEAAAASRSAPASRQPA